MSTTAKAALIFAPVIFVGSLLIARAQMQLAGSNVAPACGDERMQEHIRMLMNAGLDKALSEHTTHLYEVWMKDPSNQPARAKGGIFFGIDAYAHGRNAVEQWKLPPCG